jgi:hydrogenase expression/formation protein HypE
MNGSKIHMRLQCPMPQLSFDVITLGHGSGGLLTHQLLESGVFDVLKNDLLDTRHDGALLDLPGKLAFSTDSFVVSPLFFPGGDIGDLAVNGTVNDLAMCGAQPRFLSLAFILEEGLKMTEFWEVLLSIKAAADRAGVQIVTGDTKVVERGKGDKMFINTSGIGQVHPLAQIGLGRLRPGDQIIVSGPIATHGVAVMSLRQGLEFQTALESDTRPLHPMVLPLLDEFGGAIHFLRDPTRGGVATTLNEIAQGSGLGIRLWQQHLPIREEVSSACELLGLDPLYVANEGIFLAFVEAARAPALLEALRALPQGGEAAIIGEVSEEMPRKVLLISAIGGRRVVNMLAGEQLPRIC